MTKEKLLSSTQALRKKEKKKEKKKKKKKKQIGQVHICYFERCNLCCSQLSYVVDMANGSGQIEWL